MRQKLLIGMAVGLPVACVLALGLSLALLWTTTDAAGMETVDGPGAVLFFLSIYAGGALSVVAILGCIAWGLFVLA